MKSRFRNPDELLAFERRLRAGAAAHREPAPDGLHERVLARLPATRRDERFVWPRGLRPALVAAALLLGLGLMWWKMPAPRPQKSGFDVADLARGLRDAEAMAKDLPVRFEERLFDEAQNMLADTTRAASRVLDGLPLPLRGALPRM